MIKKPEACRPCPLYGTGWGFSEIRGHGRTGVLVLAEALGEEEEKAGRGFVGPTGQFFWRIVTRTPDPDTGLPFVEDDFWMANIVRCRPPNNELSGMPYEEEAIRRCRPYLDRLIADLQPKVILGVGGVALKALTPYGRQKHEGIEDLQIFTFDTPYSIPFIGTLHPSFIVRGNYEYVRAVQIALSKAVTTARKGILQPKTSYILHPSPADLIRFIDEFEAAGRPLLSYDIETPYFDKDERVWDVPEDEEGKDSSWTIIRISFSFREHTGITMPWQEPFIGGAKRLLSTTHLRCGWNAGAYDDPRLIASGVTFYGPLLDGMLAWKCLEPSLPMSLKFAASVLCPDVPAWKLGSRSEPELYSVRDADFALRAINKIKARLEESGRWEMFQKLFIRLSKTLMKMTKRGVRVNQEKRKEARTALEAWLDEVVRDVQVLAPPEIRRKKVFKQPLETLEKRSLRREDLVLIDEEVEKVPKGWKVGPEGFLVRTPKASKRKKKKKKEKTE